MKKIKLKFSILTTHHLVCLSVAFSWGHFCPNGWTTLVQVYSVWTGIYMLQNSTTCSLLFSHINREAGRFKCVNVTKHCSTTLLLFWKHRSDRHLSITISLIVEITIYEQQKPLLLHTWPRNTTNSQPDQRICIPGEIRDEHTHLFCCSVIRFSVNWNMSL